MKHPIIITKDFAFKAIFSLLVSIWILSLVCAFVVTQYKIEESFKIINCTSSQKTLTIELADKNLPIHAKYIKLLDSEKGNESHSIPIKKYSNLLYLDSSCTCGEYDYVQVKYHLNNILYSHLFGNE